MRSHPLLTASLLVLLHTNLMVDTGAPAPARKKIVAHGVDFKSDSATLHPEGALVLDEAVPLLNGEGPILISIDQAIDDDRGDAFRDLLTARRAKAVRQHLIDHGIDASRITLPTGAIAVATNDPHDQSPLELWVE